MLPLNMRRDVMTETDILMSEHHSSDPTSTCLSRRKRLILGTWQQIVFVELDVRPRDRTVVVRVMGD